MGKRANNEGSVYQRADGRWCAAYQVNGKRKYVYGQTQSDALGRPPLPTTPTPNPAE